MNNNPFDDKINKAVAEAARKVMEQSVAEAKEKEQEDRPDVPFAGPYRDATKPAKDKFCNVIKNRAKSLAKQGMAGVRKEEADQIDELSKQTLGSYIKKSSHDVATKGALVRHFATKSKDEKSKDNFMQARKDDETANKIFNKSWKRRQGMAKAVDRMTKEEAEQIDELSKKTKDAYVAKRGSQLSSMMYGSGKNYNSLTGKKQANAVKGIKKAMGVKEDVEQVDEAGQAKLYRMRYSHGRAWRRGDKKKQDAMGVATYDKQKKEDAKDLNRTGSAFGMRVKRLAGNRKAMGYSESTLIGKQKKLDVNKNKRLDAGDFKALRAKRIKS